MGTVAGAVHDVFLQATVLDRWSDASTASYQEHLAFVQQVLDRQTRTASDSAHNVQWTGIVHHHMLVFPDSDRHPREVQGAGFKLLHLGSVRIQCGHQQPERVVSRRALEHPRQNKKPALTWSFHNSSCLDYDLSTQKNGDEQICHQQL